MLWLEEMFPPTLKIAHVLLDTPGYHVNNVALVIHVLYRTDLLILLACHANVTTTRLLVTQTTGFAKSVSILQLVCIKLCSKRTMNLNSYLFPFFTDDGAKELPQNVCCH